MKELKLLKLLAFAEKVDNFFALFTPRKTKEFNHYRPAIDEVVEHFGKEPRYHKGINKTFDKVWFLEDRKSYISINDENILFELYSNGKEIITCINLESARPFWCVQQADENADITEELK